MCWTFCWTKCWTLFLAKIRILSAISIISGDRLGKSLGDGAGEGNRTLVFSLEGFWRLNTFRDALDKTPQNPSLDANGFSAVSKQRGVCLRVVPWQGRPFVVWTRATL